MSLYDPNEFPDAPAVVSPEFTVAEFLAWCRTKPADEEYNYVSPNACALCQFLRETGRGANVFVTPSSWFAAGEIYSIEDRLNDAVQDCGGGLYQDWTFGALVKRLEAIA